MSSFYLYECRLVVLCNLVIRKVIYTWEDSCYKGSELSDVSVLVFYICALIYFQVYVYGLLCLSSELLVNVQVSK